MEWVTITSCVDNGWRSRTGWGLHIDHCISEYNLEYGWRVENGNQMYISNIFAAYNNVGFSAIGCNKSRFTGIHALKNNSHGIEIIDCENNVVSDSLAINKSSNFKGEPVESGAIGFRTSACLNNLYQNINAHDFRDTPQQYRGIEIRETGGTWMGVSAHGNDNVDIATHSDARDTRIWGARDPQTSVTRGGTRCPFNGKCIQGPAPGSGNSGDEWSGDGTYTDYELQSWVRYANIEVESNNANPSTKYWADAYGNWNAY